MTRSGTILLPIAGRSSRFPGMRPKWMLAAPSGRLMLELSLSTVEKWRSHRVVIGGLAEHLYDLNGSTAIRNALGQSPEIVSFDSPTKGPAETIATMIRRAGIEGPIFIKDCDSWFTANENLFDDVICVADLRALPGARNVAAKSFVGINDNGIVTGITEKSVSSNFISVGGYGFHQAEIYLNAYDHLAANGDDSEPFVSHVVLEAIHRGSVFRAVIGDNYQDVGTLAAWNEFRRAQSTYFVDLDGVVLRNSGQFLPPFWKDQDVALPKNVEALRSLQQGGAQLVFLTARPEIYRDKTEAALKAAGLSWHAIVFGLNHSTRILINDYAPSNPYPSAVAVNVRRDDDGIDQLLQSGSRD